MRSKIKSLTLSEFMVFKNCDISFSDRINVFSGDNSTGKTIILKSLYSSLKSLEYMKKNNNISIDGLESKTVEKFQGVFRPDGGYIGRLVNRRQGSNKANIGICFTGQGEMSIKFGSRQKNHMDISWPGDNDITMIQPIYIPPKEIIASTENFGSFYKDYQVAFEETYADLCDLLSRPVKRGKYTEKQEDVLDDFLSIINGKVIQKQKKFYLKVEGSGEFEMGLVSEGYRKIATLAYLIQNGSLVENSVLLWDEPESNMNPKMVFPVIEAVFKLANMGVQVFLTTHSYFVQQAVEFLRQKTESKHIKFFSLYNGADNNVSIECANELQLLEHNSIMEEFDAIYNREQELFYGDE